MLTTNPDLPVAEGDNHRIAWDAGVIRARVWKRPDLDHLSGAENARRIEETLMSWLREGPRGLHFDVSEAPEAAGPKTQASLGAWFAAFEAEGVPVAIQIGDSALRRMQYGRVLAEYAPRMGRLCEDEAQVDAHIEARRPR